MCRMFNASLRGFSALSCTFSALATDDTSYGNSEGQVKAVFVSRTYKKKQNKKQQQNTFPSELLYEVIGMSKNCQSFFLFVLLKS